MMKDALRPYFGKRDFKVTSEPQGGQASRGRLSFVVQKHAASRLHYDFRLELDGTLKSWAVPKGPSLDPADKRMAVHVEDHPIDYGRFEGTIPKGQYGAGEVIVWDHGTWEPVGDARAGYAAGKLKFRLDGKKLHGGWTLVRMHGRANERQEPWLLIKERDDEARAASEYSVVDAEPKSVLSDRTIADKPTASAPQAAADDSSAPAPGGAKAKAKAKAGRGRTTTAATTSTTAAATSTATAAAAAKAEAKTAPASSKKAARPTPALGRGRSTRAVEPGGLPAGAKKAPLPETLEPQLATLVAEPPREGKWLYEIKFDGYRVLARVDGDDVRLYTRNGNDWSDRLPALVDAVRALGIGSGWLDGEIVVLGQDGAPDFNLLQNAFDKASTGRIQYYVFDLPFHGGLDLREVPLLERRARLRTLLDAAPPERIRFSEDFPTEPTELLHNACRMRLEGVIGKRADAPYVSRRSPSWIKLKCTQRQEFVVGGWTDPKGSRSGLSSLLLGIHDEAGDLRFAGAVGSGFDTATLGALRKRLEAIGAEQAPFSPKPRGVRGHWVEPTLVAEVSFGEWTPDRRVRHAVFHGLREDKPAAAITQEKPQPIDVTRTTATAKATAKAKATSGNAGKAGKSASAPKAPRQAADEATVVEGVRITHPERVIDASSGATKLDVVNHYLHVARAILPHLARRPVSLVRAPAGLGGQIVFQRHAGALRIPGLKTLGEDVAPGRDAMIEVPSFEALIGSAQMNVIEFHTWNATTKDPSRPDRMVFDLDPGEGVAWPAMREGAGLVRALLAELGLVSFLKTSGGKGLHVVVPIVPKEGWDETKAISKAIVEHLAEALPERFVAKSGAKNRVGRIFVDYLRNGFGATTASAWSARARPGLGVSVPCAWDELKAIDGGDHWTIRDAHERLEDRVDPWANYGRTRQTLAKAIEALGVAL